MMLALRKLTAVCMLVSSLSLETAAGGEAPLENSTDLKLYAQSAVLMDAGSGRILYEKNGHDKKPMASTTKIMTCILALENGNPEDYVEVSAYAAGMPKVKLNIRQGESYLLKDLLYSLMLESHNDSAVAIAEHIGGSVEGFAELMNRKAREIGCRDTCFITPNGLDAAIAEGEESREHSTTAADLARIMAYCIMESPKKEEFLTVTRTPSYSFSGWQEKDGERVPSGRNFSCNNHNAFLSMMEGALSGKTGFTGKAGYCYVGALQRDGKTYVVALLACGWPNNRGYKWKDTRTLMEYGLSNFVAKNPESKAVAVGELSPVAVYEGQTERIGETAYVPLVVTKQKEKGNGNVLMREEENFRVEIRLKEGLKAPVQEGDEAGSIQYLVGDEVYRVDSVTVGKSVEKIDFKWCIGKIWSYYCI